MEENDSLSSEMYRKLITERQDLLGIIAYALYKQDKNKGISEELEKKQHAKKHGRTDRLTDKELRSCCERFNNETYIEGLIEKARKRQSKFLDIAFQQQIEKHTNDVSKLKEEIQGLEQKCKDLRELNTKVEDAIRTALEKKPSRWSKFKNFGYDSFVSFIGTVILIIVAAALSWIAPRIRSSAADTLDELEQKIRPSSDGTIAEKTVKNL